MTEDDKTILRFAGGQNFEIIKRLREDIGLEISAEKISFKKWAWIMPVVEKIEGLGASVIIGRFFCEIKYQDPLNESIHFDIRIASGVKLNAVYGAVVQFIEWYNQK